MDENQIETYRFSGLWISLTISFELENPSNGLVPMISRFCGLVQFNFQNFKGLSLRLPNRSELSLITFCNNPINMNPKVAHVINSRWKDVGTLKELQCQRVLAYISSACYEQKGNIILIESI